MSEATDADRELARSDLEAAVYHAVNAGVTHEEILEEVRCALESCEKRGAK